MKHPSKLLHAVAAAALCLTLALPALAQSPTPAPAAGSHTRGTKVAVMDVQRILREAKAMKSIREQLVALRKTYQAEIEKLQANLRSANEDLRRKRSVLSPDAFDTERRKFDQKVAEVQRVVQMRNQELDRANNDAVQKVHDVYKEIIMELANERAYGMIFRKSATIFVDPAIEVTPEVLARLDKRLPTVKVVAPKN